MKFSALKTLFESYTGVEDVEDATFALWLNEAQIDLAYDFGAVSTESYSDAVADVGQTLPTDVLVLLDASDTYGINAAGKIVFENGGDVDLYYRAVPTDFDGVNQDQESTLPVAVHNLMAMFAASRYWDGESDGDTEESNQATKWLSYYYQGKNLAKTKLNAVGGSFLDRWVVTD